MRIALSTGEQISPVEVADQLGEALGKIGYHVRVLERTEALRLVGSEPVRGAMKHFYGVGPLVEEQRALVDSILNSNSDDD